MPLASFAFVNHETVHHTDSEGSSGTTRVTKIPVFRDLSRGLVSWKITENALQTFHSL